MQETLEESRNQNRTDRFCFFYYALRGFNACRHAETATTISPKYCYPLVRAM